MVVHGEALPLSDSRDFAVVQAEIKLDHAVALRACEVMVMMIAFAEPERMRSVGEFDAVEDLHAHKLLDGAVDSGPANARA